MKLSKKKDAVSIIMSTFLLLSFLGLIGVFMVDKGNTLFNNEKEENILVKIITMLRIKDINITATLYISFGIGYVATVLPIAIMIVSKRISSFLQAKLKLNKFIGFIIVLVISVAIAIVGWIAAIVFCKVRDTKIKQLFLVYLYFLVAFLFFAIIAFVIYVAVGILSLATRTHAKGGAGGAGGEAVVRAAGGASSEIDESGEIFPGLKLIDKKYEEKGYLTLADLPEESEYTLRGFVEGLQSYLANVEKLYYELPMLRSFVAGMATSKLIILEGLSGTGKSSLPREFSGYVDNTKYISREEYLKKDAEGKSRPKNTLTFFASVQATWRDRTDVLGFYNDFSHVFKETETLKRLYESSYTPEKFNFIVLDEMNLSRVEYYFADFLSVMEHTDHDEWKISLMPSLDPADAPKKFYSKSGQVEGQIVIPENTWFIGTANKDDSTFTITDKVYDRASVLEFNDKNIPPVTTAPYDPIKITPVQLEALFRKAQEKPENCLTAEDTQKFVRLTEFVYEKFEINFGNRIQGQIDKFVPVYVELGGTKEEALDVMFCRKVLHKLEGRFEDYIKDGLNALRTKIDEIYGTGVFVDTERSIDFMLKKLN